jgi:hypothetical protein
VTSTAIILQSTPVLAKFYKIGKLDSYIKRLSGLEPELDVATAKKVIKGFAKKIPDLKHFTEFGLKKMKDMEDTGNMIFQKYQQNTMDTKHKQKKFTQAIEKNK